MNDSTDPYDKTRRDMHYLHDKQLENIYREYGKYYMDILRSTSDMIFKWAFALNTGGLAGMITFLAALAANNKPISQNICLYIVTLMSFSLGIILIIIAVFIEHKRFDLKGGHLDEFFSKYDKNLITGNQFLTSITSSTPCYDCIVVFLEYFSYLLFLSGLGVFLYLIYQLKS